MPSPEDLASQIATLVLQQLAPASPWLTPDEAAVYLRTTKKALAHKRVAGTGPRHRTVGRVVRYNRADLDAWLVGGQS